MRTAFSEGNAIIGKPEEAKYGVSHEQVVEAYRLARERGELQKPENLEMIIRSELGFVKPGEVVFCDPSPQHQQELEKLGAQSKLAEMEVTLESAPKRWPRSNVRTLNATVTGQFTGNYNETCSAVTNSSGVAVIDTATAIKLKTIHFTFCVTNVTHATLTYDPNANVETCDSY